MLHCAGGILRNEGPLAFYKGTLAPLMGIGACVSIQFGALETAKRFFLRRNQTQGRNALSNVQLAMSGSVAGVANGFVSGPVEHIRIRASLLASLSHFVLIVFTPLRLANAISHSSNIQRAI
jgi:solute carrier family 25 (mitochondrial carnitine/acylcarnitine transporter), member 20/29